MNAVDLTLQAHRERLGLKGPRAAQWLTAQGILLPAAPNTWVHAGETVTADALLVARLGTAEFFLEEGIGGTTLRRLSPLLEEQVPGVYPVLREDWSFHLGGERVHEVLEQVCNVNFAALILDSHPVIMTLMIGVAVLVVPEAGSAERRYRIWCDPTFGPYLSESLGAVVGESGGRIMGAVG